MVSEFGGTGLIFAMLVVTGSMVNFDSGGTAAILVLLNKGCPQEVLLARGQNVTLHVQDLHYPCLSEADKGILGAAPYIGLCFGCPLAGELVRRASEKKVLLVSLAGNVVATFIFAYVLDKYYLWSAKFLVGLTQSAISVYAPVWVAKFAPASYKTLWYGLMQSSTAIGNLFGYAVCGYLVDLGVFYQRAFQIQAFWLLATCVVLIPLPSRRLNVSSHPEGMQLPLCDADLAAGKKSTSSFEAVDWQLVEAADDKGMGMISQVVALSRRPVFVATVTALCGLYFTVSAVQYWASHFFIVEFRRPSSEVTTLFIIVAGSAPFLGCVMGSTIVERSACTCRLSVSRTVRRPLYPS
jgi:MFS family permease